MALERIKGYVVGYDAKDGEISWTVKVKDPQSAHHGEKFRVASMWPGMMLTRPGADVTFSIGSQHGWKELEVGPWAYHVAFEIVSPGSPVPPLSEGGSESMGWRWFGLNCLGFTAHGTVGRGNPTRITDGRFLDEFMNRMEFLRGFFRSEGQTFHVGMGVFQPYACMCMCDNANSVERLESFVRRLQGFFGADEIVFHGRARDAVFPEVESGTTGSITCLPGAKGVCSTYPIIKGLGMRWEFAGNDNELPPLLSAPAEQK